MELYRFEEVAEGVWAALAVEGSGAVGNAGIVDLGEQTLVFDTGIGPAAGAAIYEHAHELTGRPPHLVVNSHWHGDHVFGNQSFGDVSFISTRRTRELVETTGAARLEAMRADNPALADVRLTPPTEIFTDRLDLGRAELLTFGGGHTESDAFLYLPEDGVLLSADLVVVDAHAWVGDGDVGQWLEILDRLAELAPATIVPGHGRVGGGDAIPKVAEYLHLLRELSPESPMPEEWKSLSAPQMYERNLEALHR